MGWVIGFGLLFLLYWFFLRPRLRFQKAIEDLYGDEHFLEYCRLVCRTIPVGACDERGEMHEFRTSRGVFFLYSANRENPDAVEHRYSISLDGTRGSPTAMLARPFSLIPMVLFTIERDTVEFALSPNGVFHVAFSLSPAEHEAFCEKRPVPPSQEGLESVREKAGELAENFEPAPPAGLN
jgi:hypothetical protein